ncbi:MAG: ATP synthase F1 subunit delta [Armatimonadota bacterium]
MPELRAARRYAAALFQTAVEQELIDQVARDLDRVLALMSEFPNLQRALYQPTLPASVKMRILQTVLGTEIEPLTLDFVRLLIRKRRFDDLQAVRQCYQELVDAHRATVPAQVRSAVPLTSEEETQLVQALSKATGMRVRLETSVDPDLIGGVVVRIHDTVLDGSVKSQLQALRKRLAGRPAGA